MVLIEELRSIAQSVDFHLGAGASAEGRAADEIEWLRRRVAALERVIRENLDPSHCNDGPDRKIVQEIVRRQASLKRFPPELNRRDSQEVMDEGVFVH
jgi:hypothetical protein